MTAIKPPSIGPTIMVCLGIKFVPAALALGLRGLFLSRYIAPKSTRRLTKRQEWALTGLLALMLVVIVSGEFPFIGAGEPLSVGMATAWGVCLGPSGLLFIGVIGSRMMVGLRAMVGLPQGRTSVVGGRRVSVSVD